MDGPDRPRRWGGGGGWYATGVIALALAASFARSLIYPRGRYYGGYTGSHNVRGELALYAVFTAFVAIGVGLGWWGIYQRRLASRNRPKPLDLNQDS